MAQPLEKIGPYTYAVCVMWKHLSCSQPELINFKILFSPIVCDITIILGPVLYWLIIL